MEELPDQMTPEALEALIGEYEDRLNSLPDRPETPEIVSTTGGRVSRQALGAAAVLPTGGPVHDLPAFTPAVQVTYYLPNGPGEVRIESSPARLLRVDESWREGSFKSGWKNSRRVETESNRISLTFHLPGQELHIKPPTRPQERALPRRRFEIPPPATEIKGPGVLLYESGHEVEVGEDPQPIYRPSAEGGLQPRPGGVYATFSGTEPARVRIGTTWTDTPPIDS